MIAITVEQQEKIYLLDKLFGAFSTQQLKEFTETEEVVAILKGNNNNPEILRTLIMDNNQMSINLTNVQIEIQSLRYDIQNLTRLLLKPYDYNSTTDAQNLKSKYGIY